MDVPTHMRSPSMIVQSCYKCQVMWAVTATCGLSVTIQ